MAVITVIGSGMMGSAIIFPAADNGNTIRIVGTPLDRAIIDHARATGEHLTLKRIMPKGITYYQYEEFETALEGADLLVSGVSSFGVDWFISEIIPKIPESLPVLSVTKGMVNTEDGGLISYPEVYEASTDKKISFMAVGGPCTSYELADHDPSEVTFCGRNIEQLKWARSLFEADYYHVSVSTDVRGVECAVAMKNAYALGVALAIGMSYEREGREFEHYNSQAAIFGQACREMTRLLDVCGGHPSNLALGIGDLYVTVYGGRTRKIGILLGQGMEFDKALEVLNGVTLESIVISTRTAKAIRQQIEDGRAKAEHYPLLLHIDELVNGGKKVNVPWKAFETEFEL
ncbi:MAG: glycerol-3-phosphate dehydrogenase [Clostridia bacterium]|nr:glycerol-3-phosphate dehydrogenase [Clostridia bacterium]